MEQLHIQWMDLPGPTDVMSFPMDELRPPVKDDEEPPQGLLGDIVLCPEVAKQQGEDAPTQHSMDEELQLLTVHGVLHLLGYDHEEPDEKAEMFGLQAAIVDGWRGGEGADRSVPGPDRLVSRATDRRRRRTGRRRLARRVRGGRPRPGLQLPRRGGRTGRAAAAAPSSRRSPPTRPAI